MKNKIYSFNLISLIMNLNFIFDSIYMLIQTLASQPNITKILHIYFKETNHLNCLPSRLNKKAEPTIFFMSI